MEYKIPVRNNPTDENLTKDSSIWLASRIMPGKGSDLISFSNYVIQNEAATWTCNNNDLMINALLGLSADTLSIINLDNNISSLSWNGCWTINQQAVIGKGHSSLGLVCPFNSFNVGYQYKKGWRPSRVN